MLFKMMGVVPAWYLDDFLKTHSKLISQRQKDDEYYVMVFRSGLFPFGVISKQSHLR